MPFGPRVPARKDAGNCLQRRTVVVDVGGLPQRFTGKYQVRGRGQKSFPQRHRAVGVDDHGDAAPARLGAEIDAEPGAAALGQDGAAILEQRVDIGQPDFPQIGIAEDGDGPFPPGSIMIAEIGVTSPGMCTR